MIKLQSRPPIMPKLDSWSSNVTLTNKARILQATSNLQMITFVVSYFKIAWSILTKLSGQAVMCSKSDLFFGAGQIQLVKLCGKLLHNWNMNDGISVWTQSFMANFTHCNVIFIVSQHQGIISLEKHTHLTVIGVSDLQ